MAGESGARTWDATLGRAEIFLTLNFLQIIHYGLNAHLAERGIRADGLEGVAPCGHLSGAVGSHVVRAVQNILDVQAWELAIGLAGYLGQVGCFRFQCGRGGTVTFSILAMTYGAELTV